MNQGEDVEDNLEEKEETHRVAETKGIRRWLSLGLVLLGVLMVAAAAIGTKDGTALFFGGIILILVFGWVAIGGKSIHIKGSADGIEGEVELPQDETIRTTIHKTGFSKHGKMPPKHGTMSPKDGDPDPHKPE